MSDMHNVLQVQSVVSATRGSHNRVEAAVCLYARMVDKENLWLVLYALKVSHLVLVAAFHLQLLVTTMLI